LFTSAQLPLSGGLDAAAPPWAAALRSLDASPDRLMRVRQVHGNTVRMLRRGSVDSGASGERPDGDAIVSNQPGLALAVLVADCVPILIADPRTGSAAAVHAGWRGTCARVAGAAIGVLRRECAVDPGSLVAAIGPSIGPEDYEVGEEVRSAFAAAGHAQPDLDRWFRLADGRLTLDLWAANRDQLTAAGLAPDRIYTAGLSTLRHHGFLASYRADRDKAGRMAAIIVVPQGPAERGKTTLR
jgi:YfiH family protein